jgi:hypothetical protein
MSASKTEVQSALRIMIAVAETIREAGEIPEGTLYAQLIGRMDLAGFEAMVRTLCRTGLVESRNHMLRWIGPVIERSSDE